MEGSLLSWSGIRESNPRLDLGKEILLFTPMQEDSKLRIYFQYGAVRCGRIRVE